MRAYTRNLRDTVTYWPPAAADAYGQPGFGTAETVKARWEDKAELIRSAEGDEFTSAARVSIAKAVARGGWLALGDHTGVANPHDVTGALEIKQTGRVPNLRNTREVHKAWL